MRVVYAAAGASVRVDETQKYFSVISVLRPVIPCLVSIGFWTRPATPRGLGMLHRGFTCGIGVQDSLAGVANHHLAAAHLVVGLRTQHHLAAHTLLITDLGQPSATKFQHPIIMAEQIGIH